MLGFSLRPRNRRDPTPRHERQPGNQKKRVARRLTGGREHLSWAQNDCSTMTTTMRIKSKHIHRRCRPVVSFLQGTKTGTVMQKTMFALKIVVQNSHGPGCLVACVGLSHVTCLPVKSEAFESRQSAPDS